MTRREKKQLYLELLNLVNAKFPQKFADRAKMAHPDISYATILNVRYGRSSRLDILIFLIQLLIPDFTIPEKFLEAEKYFTPTA